jgi:hypothetical protein
VSEQVVVELSRILIRLKRQQREREAAGVLSPRAARALLESRLVVEAKRGVDLDRIVSNVCSSTRLPTASTRSDDLIVYVVILVDVVVHEDCPYDGRPSQ